MGRKNQRDAAVRSDEGEVDVGKGAVDALQRFGLIPAIAGFDYAIKAPRLAGGQNSFRSEGVDKGGSAMGKPGAECGTRNEAAGIGRKRQTV